MTFNEIISKIQRKHLVAIIIILIALLTAQTTYIIISNKSKLKQAENNTVQITPTATTPSDISNTPTITSNPSKYISNIQAQNRLKADLSITANLPTDWKYSEDKNLMSKDNMTILFADEFGRGDICGFDAETTPSADCYSQTFLETADFQYTEYIVKGKTKEIVGFIKNKNLTTTILVTSGSWGDNNTLDAQQRQELTTILLSIKYVGVK